MAGLEPESTRGVFRGRLIRVAVERWPVGEREVVHHPGACAVVAITPEGAVVLVRQMREAVRSELLEIPAGVFDVHGEDGATCAARELLEETGYRASDVEPIGAIYTSPGFADERIEIFLARAAEWDAKVEDGVTVVTMPFADAVALVRDGGIEDAKTIVGILLAAGRLDDRRRGGAHPPR